ALHKRPRPPEGDPLRPRLDGRASKERLLSCPAARSASEPRCGGGLRGPRRGIRSRSERCEPGAARHGPHAGPGSRRRRVRGPRPRPRPDRPRACIPLPSEEGVRGARHEDPRPERSRRREPGGGTHGRHPRPARQVRARQDLGEDPQRKAPEGPRGQGHSDDEAALRLPLQRGTGRPNRPRGGSGCREGDLPPRRRGARHEGHTDTALPSGDSFPHRQRDLAPARLEEDGHERHLQAAHARGGRRARASGCRNERSAQRGRGVRHTLVEPLLAEGAPSVRNRARRDQALPAQGGGLREGPLGMGSRPGSRLPPTWARRGGEIRDSGAPSTGEEELDARVGAQGTDALSLV
ncbi:MAG: hypothetical protein AVDCRST_MAG02-2570, partial [uncultured Rubrobacteraceae bacterium]